MKLNEVITTIRTLLYEKEVTTTEENRALNIALVIIENYEDVMKRYDNKIELSKMN